MMVQPEEIAQRNDPPQVVLNSLGLDNRTFGSFQESMRKLRAFFGAEDFLELDLFLFQLETSLGRTPPLCWWANQGDSYDSAPSARRSLWAPKTTADNRVLQTYTNMLLIRPGDRVVQYAGKAVRALGTATQQAKDAPRPPDLRGNWNQDGREVPLESQPLETPLMLTEIPLEERKAEGGRKGPFDRNGEVIQSYLYPLTEEFTKVLQEAMEGKRPPLTSVLEPIDPRDLAMFQRIKNSLERKGQVILYGPAGTGKTRAARRFAEWWVSQEPSVAPSPPTQPEAPAPQKQTVSSTGQDSAQRAVWLIVANQAGWNLVDFITRGTETFSGKTRKNFETAREDDYCLIYEGAPTKRLVALCRVAGKKTTGDGTIEIEVEFLAAIPKGPTYDDLLRAIPASEAVNQNFRGTLFSLTESETNRLAIPILAAKFSDPKIGKTAGKGVESHDSAHQIEFLVFHPSYGYEDFMEGIRPRGGGDSEGPDFLLQPGAFKRFCQSAAAEPGKKFVLIIDEINRANLGKVFGELVTVLERDKRAIGVHLSQSPHETFIVPVNVFLIGTMNTSDRSIRLLDVALRRRFAFLEFMPDLEVLAGGRIDGLDLTRFLGTLNKRIASRVDREKQIGQAYLLQGNGKPLQTGEQLHRAFYEDIVPLLQEYFQENWKELAEVLGTTLADPDNFRIRELTPAELVAALSSLSV